MSITSRELNYLIWRYLQENGFENSTFAMQQEAKADELEEDFGSKIPAGTLVRIVQKGLLYSEIESSIREDGTIDKENTPKPTLFGDLRNTSNNDEDFKDNLMDVDDDDEALIKELMKHANVLTRGNNIQKSIKEIEQQKTDDHKNNETLNDDRDDNSSNLQRTCAIQGEPGNKSKTNSQDLLMKSTIVSSLNTDVSRVDSEVQVNLSREFRPMGVLPLLVSLPPYQECAWNPQDTTKFAVGSADSKVLISTLIKESNDDRYSVSSIQLSHPVTENIDKDITQVVWNNTGTLLVTAGYDGQMRLWTVDGKLRHILSLHRAPVLCVRWNKSGSLILSVDCTNTVVVWDVFSGDVRQNFTHASIPKYEDTLIVPDSMNSLSTDISIGTSADWIDGVTYATTSDPSIITIYKLGEKMPMLRFRGHSQGINSLRFDPVSLLLASASDDHTVRIWHGKSTSSFAVLTGHSAPVQHVRWLVSKDCTAPPISTDLVAPTSKLITVSLDGTLHIWDVSRGGICLCILILHKKAILSCEVSPDGKYIASGGLDGVVVVWDVHDFSLLETPAHAIDGESMEKGSNRAVGKYDLLDLIDKRASSDSSISGSEVTIDSHSNPVITALSWSSDSSKILVGSSIGAAIIDWKHVSNTLA
ncbi:WD40 repeat-like protein [Nadsonia fulvescens var. elongata DSM 6958]|uniref:WD40 repeat-like protein n=1 Tax=Nadsonia fulvescens var. elongata DSM 6958 TaxID=857566 RepID=A0A1E3PHE6_9ASCO|nr:WD40 repeat-like protein [Nadsonia fulvescens var. elongata DSM 6958]